MASHAVKRGRKKKKKEKKKKKRLEVGFWNCTASVSIKAVFTIFLLGPALSAKQSEKEGGASGKREQPLSNGG